MSAQSRIYVVIQVEKPQRLVEAYSPAQAIRHCAVKEYSARIPTTKEVVALMAAGVQVEVAAVEPKSNGLVADEKSI